MYSLPCRNGVLPSTLVWPPQQYTGLITADGRRVAHSLARVQMPDQIVVLEHLLDAEGQRNGNGLGC